MTVGFSFQPPLRPPFDVILKLIGSSKIPIFSVDIPSGWDVEKGKQPLYTQPDENGSSETIPTFEPEALISLTVPKMGVRDFKGRHWLGGRFVPEYVFLASMSDVTDLGYSELAKKFELNLPEYPETDQVVELPSASRSA